MTLTISVDGTELPGTVPILGVEVVSQANRIPYARLRIGDGDAARGDFAREQRRSVRAGRHGVHQRRLSRRNRAGVQRRRARASGVVVRRGSSWLEVECRDPAFKMTLVRRNRYFEDQSDSDVASHAARRLQRRRRCRGDITAATVVHPQLLQYQATDWDFMISRLEAAGQICFVDAGKVSSVKPSLSGEPVADISFGATVLELDAEIDARTQTGGVRALAWDPAGQQLLESRPRIPAGAATAI